MTNPYRHCKNVQVRWVRRWWLIFPYAVLQFREFDDDGVSYDPESCWTPWGDVFVENESD